VWLGYTKDGISNRYGFGLVSNSSIVSICCYESKMQMRAHPHRRTVGAKSVCRVSHSRKLCPVSSHFPGKLRMGKAFGVLRFVFRGHWDSPCKPKNTYRLWIVCWFLVWFSWVVLVLVLDFIFLVCLLRLRFKGGRK